MTFKEALELKNNTNLNDHLDLPDSFVLVVPRNDDDFNAYMQEFREDPKLDNRAKSFSMNNDYGVVIFYYLDISFIAYKDITAL